MTKCGFVFFILTLATAVFIGYLANQKMQAKAVLNRGKAHPSTLASFAEYGLPADLEAPLFVKNGFDVSLMGCTPKAKQNDACQKSYLARTLKFFGDRDLPIEKAYVNPNNQYGYPPKDNKIFSSGSDSLNLKEYFTNKLYSNSHYSAFRLAEAEEFNDYMGFSDNKSKSKDFYSLFARSTKFINSLYMGTVLFIQRGFSVGTAIHFTWSKSIFFMLSGRKRFLMIDPKHYATKFAGKCDFVGMYGVCLDHKAIAQRSTIDEYIKTYNLTKDDYIEVFCEPGDIIVLPDLWLHATETVTEMSAAFSMRIWPSFGDDNLASSKGLQWSTVAEFFYNSVVAWVQMKMRDSEYDNDRFGLLDAIYITELTKGPYNWVDYNTKRSILTVVDQ